MTSVGDKQILATQTLLLGDDEIGRFEVTVDVDTSFTVSVRCVRPEGGEQTVQWDFTDGVFNVTLVGWNSALGGGLEAPRRVGDLRGVPIGFNCAHQRLGGLNCVTLQFYLGGNYE